MTIVIYIILIIFSGYLFVLGINLLQNGDYGLSAVIGSVGILGMGTLIDACSKLSKDMAEEDKIIKECNDYLENNKTVYMNALNAIEEFKKRGIREIIDIRTQQDFTDYTCALTIIRDYNRCKEKIASIKNVRFKRDLATITQAAAGFAIGKAIAKNGRKENK